MTRIPLVIVAAFAAGAVAACHGPQPVTAPQPVANADSIARERARQDSIAEAEQLARVAAERDAARRRADSLAALQRTAEEVQRDVAAMIHFDFDKATIRPGDVELPRPEGPAASGQSLAADPHRGELRRARLGRVQPRLGQPTSDYRQTVPGEPRNRRGSRGGRVVWQGAAA